MSDNDQTQVSTAADAGDAGYNKALKNRHIQMIAIGGSIGTGLFLGAGGRLAQGGPALPYNAYSSEVSPFVSFFSRIGVPHAADIMQVVVLMVVGWYYVRGRVGNLTDEAAASLQGEETLVAGD